MPLNDLSLAQLKELADDLASLAKVGQSLAPLNPMFDLTPGQPTRITLDQVMPEVSALSDLDQWRAIEAAIRSSNGSPTPSTEAAQPELALEPVEPPTVEGQVGGTLSVEPSRPDDAAAPPPAAAEASPPPLAEAAPTVAKADSGGGGQAAEPSPAATHERTFTRGPDWTAEEDARLIALVVKAVGLGATKKAAMIAAAQELGRPDQATQFRCHHKLKARIDAALTAAAMAQAQTEIPSPKAARQDESPAAEVLAEASVPHSGEPPASEPEPDAGGHDMEPGQREAETAVRAAASIEGQLAEAHPEEVAPPDLHGLDLRLWQYLRRNRPRWPLTIGTDLDLVEALGRGDKLPMIAVDLGIDANKLKDRFQVLTAMILDAKDRPTIDGLQRLVKMLRRIVADAAPTKAA